MSEFSDFDAEEPIDLAHEKPFSLGRIEVRPPLRQLFRRADGAEEIVEPRIMQVLIALARAGGAIVTRDALVRDCWGGRIVGEDAINRALSRVRKLAEGIGNGSFTIETVTKVGYRLVEDGSTTEPILQMSKRGPDSKGPSRRWLIGGTLAVAAATASGALLILRPRRLAAPLPREVPQTMQQALTALSQASREGQNQAIGLYQHVVELAPDYADGWGALGNAYARAAYFRPAAETRSLRERAKAAGRRALALDPDNGLGRTAIATAMPLMGNWLPIEQALRRAVAQHPDNELLLLSLAETLISVGRVAEALPMMERTASLGPPSPNLYFVRIRALWTLNRLEEADRLMREAASIYPTHFAIWFIRFYVLMYSGRSGAAVALAEDLDARPTGINDAEIDSVVRVAQAFKSRAPADADRVVRENIGRAHKGAGYAEAAIQVVAALDHLDDAFAIADAYYFSRGFTVPEIRFAANQGIYTPANDRFTLFLFLPPLEAMRSDPRFARLVLQIGLMRYWAQSGAKPDYLSKQI